MFFSPANMAAFQAERPRPVSVYHAADARVLVFGLEPGQQIPLHASKSTVVLTVISGRGQMTLGDDCRAVTAGTTGICPPGQLHGFEATERMVVQAIIAPQP